MKRFTLAISGVVALSASIAAAAPVDPCDVLETTTDTGVQYTVTNNTGNGAFPIDPCDIVGFVVSDPGGSAPATTNGHWIAQSLTAADWNLPMGGVSLNGGGIQNTRDTWAQFTGKSFTDVFVPLDPCVGYFLDYSIQNVPGGIALKKFEFSDNPIAPGESLGGFTRTGPADSTFLAFGVPDSSNFSGSPTADPVPGVEDFVGTVPEPAAMALIGAMGAATLLRRRRAV